LLWWYATVCHTATFLHTTQKYNQIINLGPQVFQKSWSHPKILGARSMTWRKFQTQNPQILDTTVQNSVALDLRAPHLLELTVKIQPYKCPSYIY
jgi:hypothetical protein